MLKFWGVLGFWAQWSQVVFMSGSQITMRWPNLLLSKFKSLQEKVGPNGSLS